MASLYFCGESTHLFITTSFQNIARTIQMFYNCLIAASAAVFLAE